MRKSNCVEIVEERSFERDLFGVGDLRFAVLVPVRDQLLFELVGFGQELLELQAEAFGRSEIVVRRRRILADARVVDDLAELDLDLRRL